MSEFASRMTGRVAPSRLALAVLVALAALGTHQATYLISWGPDLSRAMSDSGHDGYWAPFVVAVLAAVLGLGVVAVRELRRLSVHAAATPAGHHHAFDRRAFAWRTGGLWLRLALLTAIVYAVQENAELALAGLTPSGLDALGAHGLLPILVVLATTLVVATVVALVGWRCRALLAQIRARGPRVSRRPSRTRRPTLDIRSASAILRRGCGSRAPPMVRALA